MVDAFYSFHTMYSFRGSNVSKPRRTNHIADSKNSGNACFIIFFVHFNMIFFDLNSKRFKSDSFNIANNPNCIKNFFCCQNFLFTIYINCNVNFITFYFSFFNHRICKNVDSSFLKIFLKCHRYFFIFYRQNVF